VETNGKGDKPRPVDREKYDKNFERIFNRTKKVVDNDRQKKNSTTKKQTKKKKTN
tara:strand:+ start:3636 stop:3800 length:165 start_codon:yes stop_codon:yes gene_type:complete